MINVVQDYKKSLNKTYKSYKNYIDFYKSIILKNILNIF